MLPIAHQFHCRVCTPVRCSSAPVSRLARCIALISRVGRIWQAVNGCIALIILPVAFARLCIGHHPAIAFGRPIRERLSRLVRTSRAVAYRAARQTTMVNANAGGGARTRNAPRYQPNAPFRVVKAQRRGRTHRSPGTGSPAVRPASVRELTQT